MNLKSLRNLAKCKAPVIGISVEGQAPVVLIRIVLDKLMRLWGNEPALVAVNGSLEIMSPHRYYRLDIAPRERLIALDRLKDWASKQREQRKIKPGTDPLVESIVALDRVIHLYNSDHRLGTKAGYRWVGISDTKPRAERLAEILVDRQKELAEYEERAEALPSKPPQKDAQVALQAIAETPPDPQHGEITAPIVPSIVLKHALAYVERLHWTKTLNLRTANGACKIIERAIKKA